MTRNDLIRFILSPALCVGISLSANSAEPFDVQRKAVETAIATQPESAIISLLEAGLSEEKLSQAHAISQEWFIQNQPENIKTLLLAAKVAEQSANIPSAIAFYQQYLAKADVKSKGSQIAVTRLYRLMIDVMANKDNAAYFYMLNSGEGFMPHGNAKQFNTWFLEQSARNQSPNDLLRFLTRVCRSGYSKEELTIVYGPYFRRALLPDRRFVGKQRYEDIETGKLYTELGAAITHDEHLKLVLTWRGEVWRYNAALFDAINHNKSKPKTMKLIPAPPLGAAEALLSKYPEYGALVWYDFYVDARQAYNGLMKKEASPEAKVALIKKYLPKMPSQVRYDILKTLHKYDKTLITGKELAMLNPAERGKYPKGVKVMSEKTPEPERLKEFKLLLADFDSANPKLPVVYDRLVAVVGFTPAVWPEMMKTPQRQWILYRALEEKTRVNPSRFAPVNHPKSTYHHRPPHWAEPHLRTIVEDLADKKKAIHWITMAWFNTYKLKTARNTKTFSDPQGVEVMKKLAPLPDYSGLPHEHRWASADVFQLPHATMASFQSKLSSNEIFKEVLSLTKDSDAAAAKSAITAVLDKLQALPKRVGITGCDQLHNLKADVFGDPTVFPLILKLLDTPHTPLWRENTERLLPKMLPELKKSSNTSMTHQHAIAIWHGAYATSHNRGQGHVLPFQEALLKTNPSAAATFARAGIHFHNPKNKDLSTKTACSSLLSRANQAMKLSVITVDESDPNYTVYRSQNEFIAGNVESAWKLFEENSEKAIAIHRKLSPDYMLWILKQYIDQRNEEGQETIVKALRSWRSESATAFSKGQSVRLDILYGDIARKRGGLGLDDALKIYKSIQSNKNNAGVAETYTAILRRIEVERLMKNYPAARQSAEELIRLNIPELWAKARLAKAEIFYDMEEFDEAKEIVDAILKREPGQKDATILDGMIKNKLKDLMGASEIEIIGSAIRQARITPGEMLKVTLNDPTLGLGSTGFSIEVVVWAEDKDGKRVDEELFLLRQFGDSRTKFRGTVPVELGNPRKGDKVLQVVGDDKVFFAYSEQFRKNSGGNVKEWKGGPMTIVSDSTMMASARKLLTVAEQRAADAESLTDELQKMGAKNLDSLSPIDRERAEAQLAMLAEKRRVGVRVKPGNPIYLRVIDEDRSRTDGVDTLTVSVSSSSGDSVGRVILKETGTHTGIFESTLATTGAQAMAFASSTRSGLSPNMVISPKDYPAWRAASSKTKGKGQDVFTVDLNDNVPLNTLTIKAEEKGLSLQKFRVLTGMNRDELSATATWPISTMAKNPLAPSLFITRQPQDRMYKNRGEGNPYELKDLQRYIEKGYLYQKDFLTHAENVVGPSRAFDSSVWMNTPWIKEVRHSSNVDKVQVSRFRAYFHEKSDVTREFRITLGAPPNKLVVKDIKHKNRSYTMKPAKALPFFVTLDGYYGSGSKNTYLVKRNLRKGLHRLEFWAQGRPLGIGFGRSCKIQTRASDQEDWVDCPDSMFSPDTFPEDVKLSAMAPASVAMNKTGTEWNVTFAKGSRARVISLELIAHEGPQASLNKLELTDIDGKIVLPVPVDYAELGKNETLEILTGDRVWIRYVDDRFVTKPKEKLEKQLFVGFTDAEAHFSDIEPRMHEKRLRPFIEKLLQFRHNEKLSVVVDDADMDSSDKPDSIEITLSSRSGKKVFTATETGDSTGTFRIFVIPVTGAANATNEFQVSVGDSIRLTYFDKENVRPGVPFERMVTIPHAKFQMPKLMIGNMTTKQRMLDPRVNEDGTLLEPPRPVLDIIGTFIDSTSPEADNLTWLHGERVYVNVIAPHAMLRPSSTIQVFFQTDTGRKMAQKAGTTLQQPFDITVPGTRMLIGHPVIMAATGRFNRPDRFYGDRFQPLPIYGHKIFDFDSGVTDEIGYFNVRFELIPQAFPTPGTEVDIESVLRYSTIGSKNPLRGKELETLLANINYKEKLRYRQTLEQLGRHLRRCKLMEYPSVKPGERLHIGLRYEDEGGNTKWLTASVKIATHGSLKVENNERKRLEATALGDRVNVVVYDLGLDMTDSLEGPDTATVTVSSKSGKEYPLVLTESAETRGKFEGSFRLTIAAAQPKVEPAPPAAPEEPIAPGDPAEPAAPEAAVYDVQAFGFPTAYGDTVSINYTDSSKRQLPPYTFTLGVGADGNIAAFTKRYTDGEMAVKTQFAMAEAFLEVAKRYRKLKKNNESKDAFQSAKRLLVSTIDQFTDAETRAHAEYLLGNLTYEEAGSAKTADIREERYQAALARFQKVTSDYPQTMFASKAQFKKAVVYERLKEPNVAAQEYVKLAYRFPESEHLAVALARLGTHFLKKGSILEKQSKPLLAKEDDKDAQFNGTALFNDAKENYDRSGKIFERLLFRFPDHELAAKSGLLSGKAFMRTKNYNKALDMFKAVRDEENYAGESRAEAMYWAGKCFITLNQRLAAYGVFMRCTNDYPETKWSSYSLSELAQPALKEIDKEYEIKRLEQGL